MADVEVGAEALNRKPENVAEVEVLLATHNGAPFLREQIDSLLRQDYPRLRILASDDASSDETPQILAEYAARLPQQFSVLPAQSATGSAKANFLRLMQAATGPYVCFSDQDDVWLADKVSRSMTAMRQLQRQHGADKPLLVFTDLRVVDAELKTIAPSMWRHIGINPSSIHSLPRLLGQSVVTGCTMTINSRMLSLAHRMPPEAAMHDRWIGLLAAAMGAAAILPKPTVLYRQHAANVVGAVAPEGSISGIARRASDSTPRRAERLRSELQAEALLRIHAPELPEQSRAVLEAYLRSGRSPSAFERIQLTLRHGFFRGSALKNLATLLDLARSPTK